MPLAKDLLHPSPGEEKRKHKLKRLVQHPNSYFIYISCLNTGCYKRTLAFSHSQNEMRCKGCHVIICRPQGGKAQLSDGCKYNKLCGFPQSNPKPIRHVWSKRHKIISR